MLHKLICDVYLDVEIAAVGTLCNLAVDFQAEICENDICIKRLIELSQSTCFELRYRAVFGMKNLLYKTTPELRKFVLSRTGIEKLIGLFDDETVEVQVQAVCAMRNVFHEKQDWVNDLLTKFGLEKVLLKIEEKMSCPIPELVVQSLYLLGNIGNVSEKFRTTILSLPILKQCTQLLESKNNLIKLAALSFVVSMLRKTVDESPASKKQRKTFQELELEGSLNKLKRDSDPNVKKKATQALTYLN
eukprot:TRINITY_DN16058_c0_g1_i4.p1 TRINITY_DN16058_c0_g1~~TRINITY_DN16058_c0_g1_i4.p1  ORF type:complete len:246 (+),score=54.01 TRINITY_DN16058_c0_g1_i4:345-1082(+)